MKNVALAAALAASFASSSHAMTTEIDTDGDGLASLSELIVFYPELTAELFREMDTNEDGLMDDEEMDIAVNLGILADPEVDL